MRIAKTVMSTVLATPVVAQADPGAQGGDPFFSTRLGPVPEKTVQGDPGGAGGEGDLLVWSGIDWRPWLDGLNGIPWLGFLAAVTGLAYIFAERSGIPKRLWDALVGSFNTSWDLVRRTKAGWLLTEFMRRSGLSMVGAGLWAVKQVAAVPGMIKGFFSWLARGTVENFRTTVAFVRADRQGKAQILVEKIDGALSNWEIAKALPGLFWGDIQTRWSRGWTGLVRMWTDPNVTNGELLQWGADHASMGADVAVVAPVAGAAVRGVKTAASVAGEARGAMALANSPRAGAFAEGYVDDVARAIGTQARASSLGMEM